MDALHLLLPVGQDGQNLIFLVCGQIQSLAKPVDLPLRIGFTPVGDSLCCSVFDWSCV